MRSLLILLALFVIHPVLTQPVDLGLYLGASNYNGDLTENLRSSVKQSHPMFNVQLRWDVDPVFSFKIQYAQLTISGDDRYATNAQLLRRNLNFKTSIRELSGAAQLQIFNLFRLEPMRFSPYLQMGFGFIHFDPRGNYNGSLVDLRALGTEGQGMPGYSEKYKLFSAVYMFGGGLRYHLSSHFSLGLELNLRLSNTDYLDDASGNYVSYETLLQFNGRTAAELGNKIRANTGQQRANPRSNDGYQTLGIGIHYHFGKNPLFKNSLFKNPVRCPSF
ncbi:MAG: outer membrane beta-barrel protein [Saprospiraceae bacterium]|nr:outer membrane beta-barrel protein [Saprospiraceae bacterium]